MKFPAILLASVIFATTVSIKDFKPAFGKWNGTLTYLDYSSGKPYTMPCNITASPDNSSQQQLILAYEYPNEPKANGNDTIVISSDGRMIDNEMVMAKERKGRFLQIVTEKNGVDGNDSKPATIRHTYLIGKTSFTRRKEVRFEGEDMFIMRNEYRFSR